MPFPIDHATDGFFLHDYSSVGFNAGVGGEIQLAQGILIAPDIEYNLFPFARFTQITFDGSSIAVSSSGEGIQHLLCDLNIRFVGTSDSNSAKFFFQIGAGYVLESIGSINVHWLEQSGALASSESGVKINHYWEYAIGFGIGAPLAPRVYVQPSVTFRSNGNAVERVYGLLNLNVLYLFEL